MVELRNSKISQSIHLQQTLVLHLIPTEKIFFFWKFIKVRENENSLSFLTAKDEEDDDDKANENGEEVDGDEEKEKSGDEKDEKSEGEEEEDEVKEKKKAPPKKPLPTFKGKGKHLTDIALVDINITNTKAVSLSVLHNIIYEVPGDFRQIKKNLRRFNGFDFDGESEEYKRRLEAAKKLELSKLALTADVLTLSEKGTVDELSERILTFLLKPDGSKSSAVEEKSEESENEDQEEEEEEVKPAKKAANKRPEPKKGGNKSSGGRPRRATAGRNTTKDNFSYVDYDSDEEEVEAPVVARKRGKNGSDNESEVSLSL